MFKFTTLTFCVAAILVGGLKRIATVSQIIVPFMAVIYLVFAILLLIEVKNFQNLRK
ncbi:alanine:cation symporter family protein [Peptoniphilus asaccharolyticus]|uniref:alanine:cation symporter family protein n=1 Tax=Peptoniphilus asaccharolyticus TaxID=1258 RepID=UPI00190E6381